jgi:5-methylcytosine-specific restriction endonuclease McrA
MTSAEYNSNLAMAGFDSAVGPAISVLELTQGKMAIVAVTDFAFVGQWKWHAVRRAEGNFTARRMQDGRGVYLHSALLQTTGRASVYFLNGNTLDFRRSNMRVGKLGEYTRNDIHREICAAAGRASAISPVNRERYAKRWELRKCLTCGDLFRERILISRTYCSWRCYSTNPDPDHVAAQRLNQLRLLGFHGMTGRRHSEAARTKMSAAKVGKHISPATEFKRDPATPEKLYQRRSAEYRAWRTSVFERDNFTCVFCGARGDLEADHIKPFALFPDLRFDLGNGRTLCHSCHVQTSTYRVNIFVLRKMFAEELACA